MLRFLFLLLATLFFSSIQYIIFSQLLPQRTTFTFNPLGLIFITNQVNYLLTLYFISSLLFYIFTDTKRNETHLRISGFMFVGGCFIFFGYYGLIHFHPSTQKTIASNPRFGMFMHLLHFFPFIFVVLDSMFVSISDSYRWKINDISKDISIFFIFNIIWGYICFHINKKWPYPFQNEMNVWGHVVFDVAIFLALQLLVLLSTYWQNYIIRFFSSVDTPQKDDRNKGKSGKSN